MANLVFTLEDGSTFSAELDCDLVTIGRHEDSMIPLPSPSVSSHHATLRIHNGAFYVQDLGSRNGTSVNGATVEEAVLNDGDRVTFGDVQAVFSMDTLEALPVDDTPVLAAPVVVLPSPPVPVAAPVVGVPQVQPRPARPAAPRKANRTAYASPSDGCFNGIVVIGLFLAAFVIGLSLRHYQLTERFLLNDIADHLFKNVGRIKIEKPDEP